MLTSQFKNAARFHTSAVPLADAGLFGKFNPWAKEEKKEEVVTPAQHTSEEHPVTFNVKYEDKEEFVSWKNKEIIKDQEQIESTIKSIVLEHTKDETNWKEFSLSDSNIKFQITKESMKQIGREIPNYELNDIETVKDVLDSFVKVNEIRVEDMKISDYLENNDSLPGNLKFVPLDK